MLKAGRVDDGVDRRRDAAGFIGWGRGRAGSWRGLTRRRPLFVSCTLLHPSDDGGVPRVVDRQECSPHLDVSLPGSSKKTRSAQSFTRPALTLHIEQKNELTGMTQSSTKWMLDPLRRTNLQP